MSAHCPGLARDVATKASLVVATAPASTALQGGQAGNVAAGLVRVADHLEQAAADLRELAAAWAAAPRVESPPPPAPLLSVRDLAERLGVEARTIRRWREAGQLPPGVLIAGSVVRWRPEAVDAWLQEAAR